MATMSIDWGSYSNNEYEAEKKERKKEKHWG